jgi:hypothetical protein
MQSEAMRWGYHPLAGESGADDPAGDDASEAMKRSGARHGIQ